MIRRWLQRRRDRRAAQIHAAKCRHPAGKRIGTGP